MRGGRVDVLVEVDPFVPDRVVADRARGGRRRRAVVLRVPLGLADQRFGGEVQHREPELDPESEGVVGRGLDPEGGIGAGEDPGGAGVEVHEGAGVVRHAQERLAPILVHPRVEGGDRVTGRKGDRGGHRVRRQVDPVRLPRVFEGDGHRLEAVAGEGHGDRVGDRHAVVDGPRLRVDEQNHALAVGGDEVLSVRGHFELGEVDRVAAVLAPPRVRAEPDREGGDAGREVEGPQVDHLADVRDVAGDIGAGLVGGDAHHPRLLAHRDHRGGGVVVEVDDPDLVREGAGDHRVFVRAGQARRIGPHGNVRQDRARRRVVDGHVVCPPVREQQACAVARVRRPAHVVPLGSGAGIEVGRGRKVATAGRARVVEQALAHEVVEGRAGGEDQTHRLGGTARGIGGGADAGGRRGRERAEGQGRGGNGGESETSRHDGMGPHHVSSRV